MSIKSFISEINNSIRCKNGILYLKERLIEKVWVQGFVMNIDEENKQIILDDGTSSILCQLDELSCYMNGNTQSLELGNYILMVGGIVATQIQSQGKTIVDKIHSHMFSILQDPNLETLWTIEILQSIK